MPKRGLRSRLVSWALGLASVALPWAYLLSQLGSHENWGRKAHHTGGEFGGVSVGLTWAVAYAVCFLLSTTAALINGRCLLRHGPDTWWRWAEWTLVASPAFTCLVRVLAT